MMSDFEPHGRQVDDQELLERLTRLATSRNQALDGLVREAVAQYLEREEKRAGLDPDSLQSLRDSLASGLQNSGEDSAQLLLFWGTPEPQPQK